MSFFLSLARIHPACVAKSCSRAEPRASTRLTILAAVGFLLLSVGCGDDGDPAAFRLDASASPATPAHDASSPSYDAAVSVPPVGVDAAFVPVVDSSAPGSDASGQTTSDAGGQTTSDAGSSTDAGSTKADAGTDAGGGFMIPDLFPRNDAGTAPTTDGGTGGRNPNGPCKDLNLLCIDFIDMFINAECFTCNSGKGCQGCAIPFAY